MLGGHVNKRLLELRNMVGTGGLIFGAVGLIFAGYALLNMIPDAKRYIKISTM
jgi:hypothetical protein